MLVLTRTQGQSIVIGDSIEVFIVEVRGDQVRLGIQAPRAIPVVRREVLQQAGTENREAAHIDTDSVQARPGIVAPENGSTVSAPTTSETDH